MKTFKTDGSIFAPIRTDKEGPLGFKKIISRLTCYYSQNCNRYNQEESHNSQDFIVNQSTILALIAIFLCS